MPIIRCPQCTLLITPEEAVVGKCPDCAALLPGAHAAPDIPEQPAKAAPPAPPAERRPLPGRNAWAPTAALLLLGLAAAVVCFPLLSALAWPPPGGRSEGTATPVAASAPARDNATPVAHVEIKPPAPVTPPGSAHQAEPVAAVQARGPATSVPSAATVIQIDRPGRPYVLEPLSHAAEVKLTGKVKTLVVGRIDGNSVLDASKLEATRIILSDEIGGGSVVLLNAPNGIVEVRSRVDGRATLEVNAPNGTVTFAAPYEAIQSSRIGGDAEAAITARVVDFEGAIDGDRTKVVTTFTRGGVLRFKEVAGASRLYYRKSDPTDPDPSVERGKVTGDAELKKVE